MHQQETGNGQRPIIPIMFHSSKANLRANCMLFATGVCQNLGVKETSKRNRIGALGFFTGIILALIFITLNSPNSIRLLVFVPFFVGYLGLLQAHYKTCVVLGLRGQQNMDQGNEAVADPIQRTKIGSRAIKILISAALLAGLCTLLTVAIHLDRVALRF